MLIEGKSIVILELALAKVELKTGYLSFCQIAVHVGLCDEIIGKLCSKYNAWQ